MSSALGLWGHHFLPPAVIRLCSIVLILEVEMGLFLKWCGTPCQVWTCLRTEFTVDWFENIVHGDIIVT